MERHDGGVDRSTSTAGVIVNHQKTFIRPRSIADTGLVRRRTRTDDEDYDYNDNIVIIIRIIIRIIAAIIAAIINAITAIMSAFEGLPPIVIPKKRKAEEIPALRADRDRLADETRIARKKLRAQGSFNAEFWCAAAEVEKKVLEKARVTSIISISEFAGPEAKWAASEKARNLFAQMRAQKHRIRSFSAQNEALSLTKPKGGLREAFMRFFTSSPMGLGVNTGAGKRNRSIQSKFRRSLIHDYQSVDPRSGRHIWCPILHQYLAADLVTASHIFSYKHGQAAMDSIFGCIRPPELFSSRNGLMLCSMIEKHFDAGVFVIVPDLSERPTRDAMAQWLDLDIRTFKVRIIDQAWDALDDFILCEGGLTWRELDNRPLKFKGKKRPAARYLYFHYCLQVLRRAWKAGPGQNAAFSLADELGKPVWATRGRYISRNMLKAFAEEVGHAHDELLIGAKCSSGDERALLDVAVNQIAEKAEEEESRDESSDDTDDSDHEDGDGEDRAVGLLRVYDTRFLTDGD